MIPFKAVAYMEVNFGDLEKLIEQVYKKEFQVAVDQECGNDVSLPFTGKKVPLSKYELRDFREWLTGSRDGYMLHTIFQQLVNHGHLDEGEYLIKVSW